MSDTTFASLLDRAGNSSESSSLIVPKDWMQGRAGYGGLIGALALKAMRARVPEERKVRSLQVAFVGPVGPAPFSIQTDLLRSGRSVTTIEAKVIQEGDICSTVVGSFGGDRTSAVQLGPADRPQMPEPEAALELPYIEGLTPAFTRHFAYRWALGDLPYTGKGGREIGGWIQFREDTDCLTEEWLVALADAWPIPVLAMLTEPAAASTLTWELGFVHLNRDTCSMNEWWAYHSRVDSSERGYVHEQSTVWDPDGRLAVYSRQTSHPRSSPESGPGRSHVPNLRVGPRSSILEILHIFLRSNFSSRLDLEHVRAPKTTFTIENRDGNLKINLYEYRY